MKSAGVPVKFLFNQKSSFSPWVIPTKSTPLGYVDVLGLVTDKETKKSKSACNSELKVDKTNSSTASKKKAAGPLENLKLVSWVEIEIHSGEHIGFSGNEFAVWITGGSSWVFNQGI